MKTPHIKYSTYCSNSIFARIVLNWNAQKGKTKLSCEFPNCWGSSKIDLWKLWKLEKFQKVYKRKGIQNCSPNFEFKNSKTLQTSKQKWWDMLACYYKPPLTIFWQALVGENKCHILLFIWEYQNCQKLKTQTSYF